MITKYPKDYRPNLHLADYVIDGLKIYIKDTYGLRLEDWLEEQLLDFWGALNERSDFLNIIPPEVIEHKNDDNEWRSKLIKEEAKKEKAQSTPDPKPTPPPQSYRDYEVDL